MVTNEVELTAVQGEEFCCYFSSIGPARYSSASPAWSLHGWAFSANPCPVVPERRMPLDDVYFLLTKNFLLDRPNRPLITLTTQFAAEKRYSGNGRR